MSGVSSVIGLCMCLVDSGVSNTFAMQATNKTVTEPVVKIIKNQPPGVMITSLFNQIVEFCCNLRRIVTSSTPRVAANDPPRSFDRSANWPVFSHRLNKILTTWRVKTAHVTHCRFNQRTYGCLVDSHHNDKNTGQNIADQWNDRPHVELAKIDITVCGKLPRAYSH